MRRCLDNFYANGQQLECSTNVVAFLHTYSLHTFTFLSTISTVVLWFFLLFLQIASDLLSHKVNLLSFFSFATTRIINNNKPDNMSIWLYCKDPAFVIDNHIDYSRQCTVAFYLLWGACAPIVKHQMRGACAKFNRCRIPAAKTERKHNKNNDKNDEQIEQQ